MVLVFPAAAPVTILPISCPLAVLCFVIYCIIYWHMQCDDARIPPSRALSLVAETHRTFCDIQSTSEEERGQFPFYSASPAFTWSPEQCSQGPILIKSPPQVKGLPSAMAVVRGFKVFHTLCSSYFSGAFYTPSNPVY